MNPPTIEFKVSITVHHRREIPLRSLFSLQRELYGAAVPILAASPPFSYRYLVRS